MDSLTKHDFTSPLLLFHRFLLALWAGSQNQRKRTCRVLVLELVPLVPSASKQWAEKLFLSSLDPLLLPLLSRFSRVTPETAAHQAPPRPWDSAGKNTGVGCHCLLRPSDPLPTSNRGFLLGLCFLGSFLAATWNGEAQLICFLPTSNLRFSC